MMGLKRLKFLSSFLLLSFIVPIYANYVLTDKQYEAVLKQLKRDQRIINNNNIRWNKLRKNKPKVGYKVVEGKVVIQNIEIPVYNSKPLIYKVEFVVEPERYPIKYFPLTFLLCGMLEMRSTTDFKLGIQIFSFSPLRLPVLRNIGFNILVGIKSFGCSVSYRLPKPLKNTAIHAYTGFSYAAAKEVFGVGISLNF